MSNSLKLLTAAFVLLASIALFVGDKKVIDTNELTLTFAEYDEVIQSPVKRITPVELAELLMKQEQHYYLIDLQGNQASYHIPTAEEYSTKDFLTKNLPVNEDIILYSQNETKALQLYYSLIIRGYFKVSVLQGGVEKWFSEILQPNVINIEPQQQATRRGITEFFGGNFQNDGQTFKPASVQLEKKHKLHQGC